MRYGYKENDFGLQNKDSSPLDDLLLNINSFNEGDYELLKLEPKSFYIDLFVIISGIVEIIHNDKGVDIERSTLKPFYNKINQVREYYKRKNPFEFTKIQEIKALGDKKYYEHENPSLLFVIDRIMYKIEQNWKSISVSRY